jgi:RNA recognition motif-containing protein
MTGHTKTAQKILRSQKQPAGPTLFLGNLGFETTEQSIRSLFESHRVKIADLSNTDADPPLSTEKKWIRKIRMGTFEDSGKCKGYVSPSFLSCLLSILVDTEELIEPGRDTDGRSSTS